MPKIGIGLIGGGYMGKRHAAALGNVSIIFQTALTPFSEMICTTDRSGAAKKAQDFKFFDFTNDWREIVDHPRIQAVIIASPQETHKEIAVACSKAGKHILCEKPLGASLSDAQTMTKAAEEANIINMIGFNYIRTPATQFARHLIQSGEIGDVLFFRGEHSEDFFSNPATPASWRCHGKANGTLGDLSPHMINCAQYLLGNITRLSAQIETIYSQRPSAENPDKFVTVDNDDLAQFMCDFDTGARGHLLFSRIATGRKMGLIYEITGSKGAIRFNQEDQNSLWLYKSDDPASLAGFRQILIGPDHPDYESFCLGPGHGTGYQDQLIIEMRDFLEAIATGQPIGPTFRDGLNVAKIIETAWQSHQSGQWTNIIS